MKITLALHCSATLLILATGTTLCAADDPTPPPGRPSREELREQLKSLTPAERQSKLKELREKFGPGGLVGGEMQKRLAEFRKFRESVKDLPPAERETKLREWREKNLGAASRPGAMAPEEREAARTNFSARIEAQIKALKQKKTGGALTELETRRLQRLEEMARRLETRGAGGGPGLPLPRPPGDKGGAKPVPPADIK